MIEVDHLTKRYGDFVAVDDISFSIGKGEIVGFLGPNGAGKTTTLRILSCFMRATSGNAKVCGHDVFSDSMEVRRNIGYMPENYPFYPEMRVSEFLEFRARLRGLGSDERERRIPEVVTQCALGEFRRKVIGTLSKGMRQRTALAEVLLANPPVLILDEPTAGLDPSQIRTTRALVRELAKKHTVILSTHILPEVEMTCDRVIIIHRGRIRTDQRMDALRSDAQTRSPIEVEAGGSREEAERLLRQVAGGAEVKHLATSSDGFHRLQVSPATGDPRTGIAKMFAERGVPLRTLLRRAETLEDIFARTVMEKEEK